MFLLPGQDCQHIATRENEGYTVRFFHIDECFVGGSLGWKVRGSLDAAFEKVAYELVSSDLVF